MGESEETAPLFRAHAQYYRLLAQKAEPHFFGAELGTWLTQLDKERDNIRAQSTYASLGMVDAGYRIFEAGFA